MNPLQKIIDLEKDARDFGFDWPNKEMIIEQIISECQEVQSSISCGESSERIQEEIGDLLHAAISLCCFTGYDVEETLSKTADKFKHRMSALKEATREQGLSDLNGQSIEFMLTLWQKAKVKTNVKEKV